MVSSGRERGGKRVGARRSGFLIALGLVALAPVGASQPLPMWKADHMQVAIQILPHDRIRVEEQIALDLGYERHRQLERRIRLAPLAPGRPRLDVRLVAVTDAQGATWPIRTWQWGDDLEIRIGNGESFLTGRQTIHLVYEVDGAVLPGRKRDELLWDVIGGPWEVPIVDMRVTVGLPPGAEPEVIDAGSEVGRPGELVRHADFKTIDRAQVRFSFMTGLAPRETCRVFVSWPTALTPARGAVRCWWDALALRPWWGVAAAALLGVGLAAFARHRARGSARAPNAPQPRLAPAELAFLREPLITPESWLGTVLDLAQRKELAILPGTTAGEFRLELPAVASGSANPEPSAPPSAWHPFESAWRAHVFSNPEVGAPAAERACSAAELGWRTRLAQPAAAAALTDRLVAAGFLHDRSRGRIVQRMLWRLAIAIALCAFLALLVGARFPASWPGIAGAGLGAALLPLVLESRRRTRQGEAAAAWAEAFADRTRRNASPIDEAQLPLAVALAVGPEALLAGAERPSYWPALGAGAPVTRSQLWREWEALRRPFESAGSISARA